MWRAWVRASWVLGALVLWAGSVRAECTKDIDCEGEQLCEAGACVDPPPAPATPPTESAPPPPAPPPPNPAAQATMASEPRHVANDPPPAAETVRYKRRSRGLMVGGIVAASVGTLALLVAASSEGRLQCTDSSPQQCHREPEYGAWVLAVVLLGSGIPMIAVGAKKVPDTSTPTAAVTPWLTLDGGGVGLRLAL